MKKGLIKWEDNNGRGDDVIIKAEKLNPLGRMKLKSENKEV